ncbi:MAG: hypothetical protein ACPG6B_08415 [Oceanihabitans sp.]
MKHFSLILVSLFLLTSCNFTEEITFKEDGSGEFVMRYDLSQVLKTMEEMGGGNTNDNEKEKVKMDSVVYFKDMLVEKADSIATLPQEEQDQLKALESIVIKMKMDEEKGVLDFGFGSTFTSIHDLPVALKKIEQAKKFNAKDNPEMLRMNESAVAKSAENMLEYVDFAYNGKTFSRKLLKDHKKSPEQMEALDAEINKMSDTKSVFEAMSYTLLYHFPNKVKSVSNKNATISADKKSVTLKMNFLEMIKSPEIMTLDVKLED